MRRKTFLTWIVFVVFCLVIIPISGQELAENYIDESENVDNEENITNTKEEQVEEESSEVEENTFIDVNTNNEEVTTDSKEVIEKTSRGLDVGNNTYIAYTIDDLKTYCAIPNAKIHFGNDISWTSSTAASKAIVMADGVVVSGKDYYTEQIYTYDYNVAGAYNESFQINSNNRTVRFEDLNIIGVGYYGIACSHSYTNVVQIFHNVTFTGPNAQPFYMTAGGKVVLSGDTSFTQTNEGTYSQEFGQFTALEILEGSNVEIEHISNGTSANGNVFMWMSNGSHQTGSFIVRKNASLKIKTNKTLVYPESNNATVNIEVEDGASFVLDQTTNTGNQSQLINRSFSAEVTLNIGVDASFEHTSMTNGNYAMFNTYDNSKINVGKNGTLVLKNLGSGKAISGSSANARITMEEAKYVEFTSQSNNPIAFASNASGNIFTTKQLVKGSTDNSVYQDIGFAETMVLNHYNIGSSVVSTVPSPWNGLTNYNAMANTMKSIVFTNIKVVVQEPITNEDTSITVNTMPNAEIRVVAFVEDGTTTGTMITEVITANDTGIAILDLEGKKLLAGTEVKASVMLPSTSVDSLPVIVKDVRGPAIVASRITIPKDSSVTILEQYVKNAVSAIPSSATDNPTVSYDISSVDLTSIGVYHVSVIATSSNGNTSTLLVPVFVYDENCIISPLDSNAPLKGVMISAKDFEKKAVEIIGDLEMLVTNDSGYVAWDENGSIATKPSIDLGTLSEIPLAGSYPISFTINGLTKTIIITVTSENAMINISIPKKMLFGSLATANNQEIFSPEYTFKNNTNNDVSIYIDDFIEQEASNLNLVADESQLVGPNNQAVLNISSDSTMISGLFPGMPATHFLDLTSNQETAVKLNGKYKGSYDQTLKPVYRMILRFELKQ